jgi:hypothetical protein
MTRTIQIELNLRIPVVKEPRKNADGYPINSADVRFLRDMDLPELPKPGGILQLHTKDGPSLECEVQRVDWSEGKDRFVVSCKYAKRSIPPLEYNALFDDPGWIMKPLL